MGEILSDVGEFGLIRRLLARVPIAGRGVEVGPGDDAAVLLVGGRPLIATADLLVEGRHFDLRFSTPGDVGFKALTVNVSDVAAMGARPLWALLSIGVPSSTPVATLEDLYDGIAEAASLYDVVVVGGDMVAADGLIVSVAVLGEPGEAGVVTRGGAREGDLICVTGELGAAAAGLALLRGAEEEDADAGALLERFPHLAEAHRRPRARVREGLAAAAAGARAMIDISDGFEQDVGHICEASGIGVRALEALPVAAGVSEVEGWLGVHDLAAGGGDDYELAIAVPPGRLDELRDAVAPTPVTAVGGFADVPPRETHGWDSFRGAT